MPKQATKKPLAQSLKEKGVKPRKKRTEPLWKGPEGDGVTQSMLGAFLVCRERFRLKVVEGLRVSEGFNHRLGYGDMWHVCEEAVLTKPGDDAYWRSCLMSHCKEQAQKHRMDQAHIEKWYQVCRRQFALYLQHWSKSNKHTHPSTPMLQEEVFEVPIKLPSDRIVWMKGKMDGVNLVPKRHKDAGVWLQENKTKGDVDQNKLTQQLRFDLQSMFYLNALLLLQEYACEKTGPPDWFSDIDTERILPGPEKMGNLVGFEGPIRGVMYNVIRRPLSGGKGSIVQRKGSKNVPAETAEEYYDRLAEYIKEDPDHFFMRFDVRVSREDILRFRQRTLIPILEQLCDWWGWIVRNPGNPWDDQGEEVDTGAPDPSGRFISDYAILPNPGIHWQHPYGVYNILNEGGRSDLDDYLETGNEVGLTRVETLFPELQ